MSRIDISKWVMHFIHRRNPINNPAEMFFDPEFDTKTQFPDGFTYEGNPIYKTVSYEEEYLGLASDELAYGVLKKILHDGYIRAGWSYRKDKPTIYGPKAATCFTEMPLYGLIEYAKNRNSPYNIQDYGIAFLKDEIFNMGARPVIYGLSSKYEEADTLDPFYGIGLRTLSSKCGIGLKEQYRYVSTNLSHEKRIDWMHEREWRWADLSDEYQCPGMPFYLENDGRRFSKIIIIVKENEEEEDLVDYLKTLYDSKTDLFGREYNLQAIQDTYILSLARLSQITANQETVKLEDLPTSKLGKIKKVIVSPTILERVKEAWKIANILAYEESEKFNNTYPNIPFPSGFARIVTFDSHSEVTQALLDLEIAVALVNEYAIYGLNTFPSQAVDVAEVGAKVAAKYLTKELSQAFYVSSRLD